MRDHRVESDLGRDPSETPQPLRGRRVATRPVDSDSTASLPVVGRRAARPGTHDTPLAHPGDLLTRTAPPAAAAAPVAARVPAVVRERVTDVLDTGEINAVLAGFEPVDQTTSFESEPTERLPVIRVAARPASTPLAQVATTTTAASADRTDRPGPAQPGKRRAVKHAGRRGPLFRGLPSAPVLVGVAALACSVVGVVSVGEPELASSPPLTSSAAPASALSGTGGVATAGGRGAVLTRDSARQALGSPPEAASDEVQQRNAALEKLASAAQTQSDKIERNQWVVPLDSVVLTAVFGQYGLWSSYHTGLDFNGNTGDSIYAVANGTVTSTGYDGAYGNKTVITLDDGTEIWFCHQTSIFVSVGDVVRGGETIGTVGTTGNVTGSHLHLEVRPGGGDPVDPAAAFAEHGVNLG